MIELTPPSSAFRMIIFGGPRLLVGGEACPLSPFQRGFLGFLFGRTEGAIHRDEVLSMLWPEDDPPKARRRLNQLLYTIKRKTGSNPPFDCVGDQILKAPSRAFSDLDTYHAALLENRLSECTDLLIRGFLRQASGSISSPFSDWIEGRDRELRSTLRRKIRQALQACEASADWEGARDAAEALSSLAPLDEDALRTLMRARARLGGTSEAESALSEFAARREATLGSKWNPRAETISTLERIHSEASAGGHGKLGGIQGRQQEPRLVGRDAEHALLRRTLATPPHQAFRGILVTGEAGIGKTRLIREAFCGLALEGQAIFSTDQAELEQMIPLNPLIEALREPGVGKTLTLLDDPWRAVLYGVMPSHYSGRGPIPQAPPIQPGSVPRRLFEAFHQLLLRMVAESPVVLVIEDLQWADETTLSVLEFLFRRWDQGRLQAVFSLRSEEISRTSALRTFLEMLRVHSDFLEIPLGDLSSSASKSLIKDTSGKPLTSAELNHLHSLAGGNPFFLIELTLEYLAGRVDQPSFPEEMFSIPLSIRQVLERRLGQLSPAAEKALGALSASSKVLRIQDLANVAGLSTSECMTGLDQLHSFRLVRSIGVEIYVGHELIRQTVYQGLSASRRAWLHAGLARHIQESSQNPPPDELAIHFHFAGAKEEALVFAKEAAEKAEASGAIPEALRFLGIAREHTDEPEDVAKILGRMGHLHYLHQNLEEAAPLLETAAQRFRRQGLDADALRAELERVDALWQTELLPFRECLEELERIKKEAKENGHWETFMKALDVAIHLLDRLGDSAGVKQVIQEARIYSDRGDAKARCHSRSILALNVYFGTPSDGLHAAREAVSIALETGNVDLELHALNRLIVVLLYQGRLHSEEGVQAYEEAGKRFGSSGDLILKFFIKLNRVVWHLEVGELDQAASAIPAVEAVIRGTRTRHPWAMFHLNRGEVELESEQIPRARESFSEALSLLTESSPRFFRTILTSGLGLCALRDGNLSEAKRLEAELGELPKGWTFDPSVVAAFKAEMFRMRGDLAMADRFLGQVSGEIRDRFVTGWVKIGIQRTKILKRIAPDVSSRVALETLEKAQALNLLVRSREIERLLA